MDRPQLADAPGVEFCEAEPLDVLWIGDATLAQRFMSRRAPHVRIAARDASGALDFLRGLKSESHALDLIVIDVSLPGMNPLPILATAEAEAVDVPVLLLTEPGQDDLVNKAGRLAVCECLIKTQDYLHQILYSFGQLRLRHDLVTVLGATRQDEERLKVILETQPAVVCVINADTRISAMNRAGLMLLGVTLEQVIGTEFTAFLPAEQHEPVRHLLRRVCGGDLEELQISLRRSDDSSCNVRMEALPLPRAEGVSVLATFHEGVAQETAALLANAQLERERLERLLDQSLADRDQARTDLQCAQVKCGDLEREQEHLGQALDHTSAQCEAHAAEQYRLKKIADDLRARLEAVESERRTERDQLAAAHADRDMLTAAQREWEDAARESGTRHLAAAACVDALELERKRLSDALRQASEQCSTLEAERARLTTIANEAQAACEAVVAEQRDRQASARETEPRDLAAQHAVDELEAERDRLTTALQKSNEQLAAFDAERVRLTDAVRTSEHGRQELAATLAAERAAWTDRAAMVVAAQASGPTEHARPVRSHRHADVEATPEFQQTR